MPGLRRDGLAQPTATSAATHPEHLGPRNNKDGTMTDLHTALKVLNKAAYDAIRAGSDTTAHPMLDRQALREIARATDKLVDDNAPEAEQ